MLMAHGDAREGKWRGNWRMEWVASTLHTTSEHGVSSINTADAHISAASSWLNWRPCRFKWTRPFRRKTKSGFCACAITFQTRSTWASDFTLQLQSLQDRNSLANKLWLLQRAHTGMSEVLECPLKSHRLQSAASHNLYWIPRHFRYHSVTPWQCWSGRVRFTNREVMWGSNARETNDKWALLLPPPHTFVYDAAPQDLTFKVLHLEI